MNLNRVDYLQVGITAQRTLKVLPLTTGSKSLQKIVVGDQNGVLRCFGMKNRTVQHLFSLQLGKPVSCLSLGNLGGLSTKNEKIYSASYNQIFGHSKKGNQISRCDTFITEPIKSMYVKGTCFVICGDYIYTSYDNGKDKDYYLCNDRICDVAMLMGNPTGELSSTSKVTSLLACHDNTLRVIHDSNCIAEVSVSGPATAVLVFPIKTAQENVIYGTADGKIGMVSLFWEKARVFPVHRWNIENGFGGVQAFDLYDLHQTDNLDLIVGRDDGRVEVYSLPEIIDDGDSDGLQAEPQLMFSFTCNESITSVQGGVVGSAGYHEIIVCTYTGWIFGLTPERFDTGVSSVEGDLVSQDTKNKLARLRTDIERLTVDLEAARQKQISRATSTGVNKQLVEKSGPSVGAMSVGINDKMTLCADDASYLLTIEVQTPLDMVLLQSDVRVDIMDVEKNSAVASISQCSPESGNCLLVTYRCQSNTTRLEIRIRTIEGERGTLKAYIIPVLQPLMSYTRQYPIKPLSLHQKIQRMPQNRLMNVLRIKGLFSLAEMHFWLVNCLPDLPERPPGGDTVEFVYTNTFLSTVLVCEYSKNSAIFKSDNMSTISVLKEFISREATSRKMNLQISCEVNEESIAYFLNLIHPKLKHFSDLSKQIELIDTLKEIEMQEKTLDCFTVENRFILENCDQIRKEYARHPKLLDRLFGMVVDLYLDKFKFKGMNMKSKVPVLLDILQNYRDVDDLVEFFGDSE